MTLPTKHIPLFALGVCLSLTAPIGYLSSAAAVDGVVQARLAEATREHEPVFVQEPIRDSFFIENTGDRAFRIANVKATCSCATAVVTKGAIRPGERAEIDYEMHSGAAIHRSVGIRVQTDPPLDKPLVFMAKGSWKPVIDVAPADLAASADFGHAIEHRVPLRAAPGAGPLKIVNASTRQIGFDLALEAPPPNSDALAVLIARSTGPVPPGRRNLGVTLSYERNRPGTQSITLSFTIRSDFDVSPKPLVIPVTAEDPEPAIALTVRNTKGDPFTIKAVRAERCEIRKPELPQAPSAEQVLSITFKLANGVIPRRGLLLLDLGKDRGVLPVDVYFVTPRARP